jgi:hypothetical protein
MSVTPLDFPTFIDTTADEQRWQIFNAISSGSSGGGNVAITSPVDGSGNVKVDLQTALPAGTNTIGNVNPDSTGSGSVTPSTPFAIATTNFGTLAFQSNNAATGTITIEGSVDGTNYTATTYVALTSGASSSNFNAGTATIGQIDVAGLAYIRFRSNTITGTCGITYNLSRNVSNVMLDNSLPAGSNVIGGVTLPVSSTASVTTFTSTSSAQILAANSSRKGIVLYNQGAGNVFVLLGTGTASASNFTVGLGTSDTVTITGWTGAVQGIFATAGTLNITELS